MLFSVLGCLLLPVPEVKAVDALCLCTKASGELHFYNLGAGIPNDVKKCRFVSSTVAKYNTKKYGVKARNKLCKKGSKRAKASKKAKSSSKAKAPSKKLRDSGQLAPVDRIEKTGQPPATPFNQYIETASKTYDIPVALIHAVVRVESNYKPDVVSSAGAQGLMQLMPGTASDMKVADPFDPEQNIQGGTKYLRRLADHYDGDIIKTLAAYHAGFRAVDKKNGIPYEQTEKYVKKVLSHYYRMRPAP